MDLIAWKKKEKEKGRSKTLSLSPAHSPLFFFCAPPSRMSDRHTPRKKMDLLTMT